MSYKNIGYGSWPSSFGTPAGSDVEEASIYADGSGGGGGGGTTPTPTSGGGGSFSWSIGSTETDYSSQLGNAMDMPVNYVWDSKTGKYWHIGSYGGYNAFYVYSGTSLSNMTRGSSVSFSGFTGIDTTCIWPEHIWRNASDGKWYTLIHYEYNYNDPTYGHLCKQLLAHCNDDTLVTWNYDGDVLSKSSSDGGCYDAQYYFDSSYIYAFFHLFFDGYGYSGIHVARAPINSFGSGSWSKWYNGSWSQPGLGGNSSAVVGNDNNWFGNCGQVSWNTYLNRYIMVFSYCPQDGPGHNGSNCFQITDSSSLTSWNTPQDFSSYYGWYHTLQGIGSDNGHDSENTTGQNCILFYSSASPAYGRNVTFTGGSGGSTPTPTPAVTPTATPTPTSAVIPGKIEAENYSSMYGVQTETTTDTGGGLDVGWIDTGDWINYNVNVQSAGSYTVQYRVASTSTTGQIQLKNSGGTVLATTSVPNTGGWQNWQTVTATVSLSSGNQTLQVYASGGGWNLNWMNFVSGSGSTPTPVVTPTVTVTPTPTTGSAAIPGKVEAENYSSMYGVSTETTTDTGGGLDVGWIDTGDWMNYNVNVQSAGSYTVQYRVASTSTTGQVQLKNSGGTVLATTSVPNTGGWQTWQTVTATVSLSSGNQTLQVYASGGGWNFNWMNFISGGGSTPTPVVTPTVTPTPTPGGAYIGYNVAGSSTDSNGSSGDMAANQFTASSSFTATQMKLYINSAVSGKVKCAIYSDSSGSPGSLLGSTAELTNPGAGWQTFSGLNLSITSGTKYWLVSWENVAGVTVKCETSGGTFKYRNVAYGTWPSTFGSVSGSDVVKYSIYAQ